MTGCLSWSMCQCWMTKYWRVFRHLRHKIVLWSSSVFYRLVRGSKLSSVSARVLVLLRGVSSVGSSPLFTRQQRMWHRFPEHGVLGELNPPSSPRLCGRSADPNKSSLCPGAECGGGDYQDQTPVVQTRIQCQCRAAVELSVHYIQRSVSCDDAESQSVREIN